MKFDDYRFSPEIRRNLADMGLKRPTDIQFKAIPPILNGEDVLAIAQTGTGKTAAFAIPIVHLVQSAKRNGRPDGVRCVVMAPTRELSVQIAGVFDAVAKGTRVKTMSVFGGVEQDPQIARLNNGVDIVVATPGRLFDLHAQGHLQLDRVKMLVLDEADRMLELGFLKDIQDLIKRLPHFRQTLFFSATIDEKIKKLAYSLVRNAIRIQISPQDKVTKNVTHAVAWVEMDDKRFFLSRLVEENPDTKMVVFVRTKIRAERVLKALERAQITAVSIHGDKDQRDRMAALDRFKKGEVKILIATDITARGIDIPDVDMVVNYDLPDQPENYVHRIGRTGRGVRKGQAVSFCSKEEKPLLEAIENWLDSPVSVLKMSKKEYEQTVSTHTDLPERWTNLAKELDFAWEKERKKRKQKS